ncbi:hypothetical protein [Gimesia sp.]|uniref:hypothetical protein n=1 Tax=Gimesia sp. TaxID=2024833 RepID=UPI0032F01678
MLHVSRHCAMEIGKDVIAIAPDGVPCAYQLKGLDGGMMTLSKWRDDLGKQLHPLVHAKIVHPSLNTSQHHRSYIVVNGDFHEVVQREIDDFNRGMIDAGQPERVVTTIVKGELFQAFNELQSEFWATNLNDLKTYLELFLEDGSGPLPKQKLASLLHDALPLEPANKKRPSNNESARSLVGAAVICSAAISSFTLAENHVAEFEAWTIFWCYTMGLAEKWKTPFKTIEFAANLASDSIFSSLGRLCDELITREHYFEGDPLLDRPVYGVRMTQLLGLMGLYGLLLQNKLRTNEGETDRQHLDFAIKFCEMHKNKLLLWGEYAIPQFLAWNYFRKTYDATPKGDFFYSTLIKTICRKNNIDSKNTLPNAYYDAEAILPYELGLANKPLNDSFSRYSHYLESLMHLFIRGNYKQEMKSLFPDITQIGFRYFDPGDMWRYFMYRNEDCGTDITKFLVPPHKWEDLRRKSEESNGDEIPFLLKEYPLHYLTMLLVMPYRVNASGLRWLDTILQDQIQDKSWMMNE